MNKKIFPLILFLLIACLSLTACLNSNDDDEDNDDSNSSFTNTVNGDVRTITSNGIPDHGLDDDTNYANDMTEQDFTFTMDATPEKNTNTEDYMQPQKFGVATNGVPLDPFTNEYYNNNSSSGWHIDATGGNLGLDKYGGHIQPSGAYHYHSVKTDFFDAFDVESGEHSPLVGYASDGFPVYALYAYSTATNSSSGISEIESNYRLKSGTRPSGPGGSYDGTYIEDYEFIDGLNSDLNDANARYGVTPDYPSGTWYYVLTESYPYIPIKMLGDADSSFSPSGPGGKLQQHSHPHHIHL